MVDDAPGDRMNANQIETGYMEAAWQAMKHFPVNVQNITFVSHSENITFRVAVRDGETDYVLRLHRPGYCSIEELESERIWVNALKETGIHVPDSLETHEGGHFALVDIPGTSEKRYAGLTTWHEGAPLRDFLESDSDLPRRKRVFSRFGEIAALFHHQSTRWQAPPGFTRRRLDLDGLLGEAPYWGRFWEHPALTRAESTLLLNTREKLRDALDAYGEKPENFSLIHADFTADNIIYDGVDLAVIDFDDSAYGWHMYDIASALLECCFDNDFEALQAAMMEAYLQNRPLPPQDVDRLPDFLLVRGMAIIGWFYQRPEYAGPEGFDKFKNWVLGECERRGRS